MARTADPRKAAAWQRRLQRFTASGTTVSKFCDRAGVSVAAFHYWWRSRPPSFWREFSVDTIPKSTVRPVKNA